MNKKTKRNNDPAPKSNATLKEDEKIFSSKSLSRLHSAGLLVVIVTSIFNLIISFSIAVYQKKSDLETQEHLMKLQSSLDTDKELLIANVNDSKYFLNLINELYFHDLDILRFYTNPEKFKDNPPRLKKDEISDMINKLFQSFKHNYKIYQRAKAYLTDEEIKKIESYLLFHRIENGYVTMHLPQTINPEKISKGLDHIGYANQSYYLIKQLEENELPPKGIADREMWSTADLLWGTKYFPQFLTNIIISHVRKILHRNR